MITKKMSINEIVQKNPQTAQIMMKHGMHCIGCMASQFETFEEGCKAHGLADKVIDEMVKEMNELIKKKGK